MPISGLVLTLARDPRARRGVLEALDEDSRITLGALIEPHLPLVVETATLDEHDALWRELEAIEGVLQVRLAFHDFSDISHHEEVDREPT